MTCVIAWTDGQRTIMASDSAISCGDQITLMKDPKFKIFLSDHNPDLLIGYAGRAKAGQVIKLMRFDKIPKDNGVDPATFISQVIVPVLQVILRDNQLTMREKGEEFSRFSVFLVAYRGKIFQVGYDFFVSESSDEFTAIGSGQSYALGAMTAAKMMQPEIPPEDLVNLGMLAAEKYSAGVRQPFKMIEITSTKNTQKPKKKSKRKNS